MTLDWSQIIVGTFGVGGVAAAVVAFYKARPEAARIAVSASEGAVVVQSSVITSLNSEIGRLRTALGDALAHEKAYKEAVERGEQEIDEARVREHTLLATLNDCVKRADGLEQRIAELSKPHPPHNTD